MALVLAILQGSPAGPVVVNQKMNFVVSVTNTGAAAASLTSLTVNESTESDAIVEQISFQTPNTSPGVTGNPLIAAGATAYFPFSAIFTSPNTPGVSPNNPGGAAPGQDAMEVDANFTLQAQGALSDGSMGSTSLTVPALSAVAPFPVPTGGATQFGPGTGADSALLAVIL